MQVVGQSILVVRDSSLLTIMLIFAQRGEENAIRPWKRVIQEHITCEGSAKGEP